MRNAGYDAAAHQHIHIGKSGFLCAVGKVFVANVAPADDAGAVVGGEGFVVHTAVDAGEVGKVAQRAPFADEKGVEQADLDIRMRVQRGEDVVRAVGVVVIQQEAHAHATLGGLAELLQQLLACGVVVPDVVLRVDGYAGVVNQAGA